MSTAMPPTNVKTTPVNKIPTTHVYHAKANILSGDLERPIVQRIEPQAPVELEDRRGGLFSRSVDDVSFEGFISFTKGQTRVSGARSLKHQGWVTLATSAIEGFNVFETLTTDRMVMQISTDHPLENGHIPQVTFLGTQFGDVRLSGFPIGLKFDLGICGPKPNGDRSYLRDHNFLTGAWRQTDGIVNAAGLPKEIKSRYIERRDRIDSLIRTKNTDDNEPRHEILCSLIQEIDISQVDPGLGVKAFGHVLVTPEFGVVEFGEITVGEKRYEPGERPCVHFEVTGMKIKLGCAGSGTQNAATAAANGHSHP